MATYRLKEVADLLKVSMWFLRRECAAGRFPYRKVSERLWLFTESDIAEYLRRTACNQSPASEGGES